MSNASWRQDGLIRSVFIWRASVIRFWETQVYGPAKVPFSGLQGQTLHAGVLGIIHPSTGEYMEFHAPLPEYFEKLLRKLEQD